MPLGKSSYPSVPHAMWSYHEHLVAKGNTHKLLTAIDGQGPEKTWKGINDLFHLAAKATNLTPDDLLVQLGFNRKDLDEANFQAMLGVLRAINMLHNIGFSNIRPLPPSKLRREVDFVASFRDVMYAVEVFRSSETAYRFPDHNKASCNPSKYIADRYAEKRSQFEATMQAHQTIKALLVVVMDSQPFKALTDAAEQQAVTEEAFVAMGNPINTHLLLFTGMADDRGRDLCSIHPPL
jgi:hypothetical protein